MTEPPNEVLPPLTPIDGIHIGDPIELLSDEDAKQLRDDLKEMARCRRRALDAAANWSLS